MPRAPAAAASAVALPLALALALFAPLAGAARAQEPEAAAPEAPPADAAPRPKSRPPKQRAPKPERPAKGEARPAPAAAPEPAPPALPLEAYVEAATTTIIAEQTCPGVRLDAGQLTNLRLAARVAPAQEGELEERLRARSAEVRQQRAADGREAWCAGVLGAYGPAGTVARGVLATRAPAR